LHLSAEHGHSTNVSMLLQHDSDLHIRDANEMTPLDLADKSGHAKCVALLKEAAGECFMSIICINGLFYLY
jgi:ankyrin repeat protein